jgi:prepilin-type N-terminal cleavage/methylation domain-containing protein
MNRIKSNRLAAQSGSTLIELSVVIAVILLLASVLFIGVTEWKKGANRAAAIVTISSIQKAARGYENMNQLNVGDTLTEAMLAPFFGAATATTLPLDVSNNNAAFAFLGKVPDTGVVYATSGNAQTAAQIAKMNTAAW